MIKIKRELRSRKTSPDEILQRLERIEILLGTLLKIRKITVSFQPLRLVESEKAEARRWFEEQFLPLLKSIEKRENFP